MEIITIQTEKMILMRLFINILEIITFNRSRDYLQEKKVIAYLIKD